MKKLFTSLIFVLAVSIAVAKAPLRIACVGDSITFGVRVEGRINNSYSYSEQLERMLREGYVVENFGLSSTTVLSTTDKPYNKTPQYRKIFEFKPDIIFIALGTNDSKVIYRDLMTGFESDYHALINSFKEKLPEVEIVILAPTKSHNVDGKTKIDPTYLTKTIVPMVQKIAYDTNLDLINLHPLFEEWVEDLMPDKVHPSAAGASMIAQRIYEYLSNKDSMKEFTFDESFTKSTNFYGYKCYEFTFEGKQSRVVVPRKAAPGNPWVWRARFWNRNITTYDEALLERGYHIVYNHVANMFGSDKAVAQWDKFYEYVISKGLAEKCVIECISRGGLIAYRYAMKYPERVSTIVADAPVLDIKSWPLSHAKEVQMSKKLLEAYGFKSREEAMAYTDNPIDNAEKIAKLGINLIHVFGDSDTLVPHTDNTLPFAKRIKKAGGQIALYSKAGCDHHPHGYYHKPVKGIVCPDPVISSILRSSGLDESDSTVPRIGYRKRNVFTWLNIAKEISDSTASREFDILLLGNSLTQAFSSNRKFNDPGAIRGLEPMNKAFPDKTWFSAGIGGDRTQHLLYRILYGDYEKCNPKYVVVTIGVNNLSGDRSTPREVLDGIKACVDAVKIKMPNAKIILFGLLPSKKYYDVSKPIALELEKTYKKDKKVTYVNPYPHFSNKEKTSIEPKYYVKDGTHLTSEGYEMWTKLMNKYIK